MLQPAVELPVIDEVPGGDLHDCAFFRRRYCCLFNFTCFESRKSDNWERISLDREISDRNWWRKGIDALKKVREWSEVVARPKWKTFIRRFNRTGGRPARTGKFQYDPSSYSLNFDGGQGQNGDFESDLVFRDSSSRYSVQSLKDTKLSK